MNNIIAGTVLYKTVIVGLNHSCQQKAYSKNFTIAVNVTSTTKTQFKTADGERYLLNCLTPVGGSMFDKLQREGLDQTVAHNAWAKRLKQLNILIHKTDLHRQAVVTRCATVDIAEQYCQLKARHKDEVEQMFAAVATKTDAVSA